MIMTRKTTGQSKSKTLKIPDCKFVGNGCFIEKAVKLQNNSPSKFRTIAWQGGGSRGSEPPSRKILDPPSSHFGASYRPPKKDPRGFFSLKAKT